MYFFISFLLPPGASRLVSSSFYLDHRSFWYLASDSTMSILRSTPDKR